MVAEAQFGRMRFKPCPCGSGNPSAWQYDARNIPLFRSCRTCKAEKMRGIRPEVLTNPNYATCEPIEED